MRRATLFTALAFALLVPATALAGGWATAGVSSLPEDGLPAGRPWDVDLTILQHGVTPLEGIKPAVVVQLPGGGEERFGAKPTGEPGVYHARVVFPKEGRYSFTVDDGFTNALPHTFAPVEIGPATGGTAAPAAAVGEDPMPLWPFLAAGVAVIALLATYGSRRQRSAPA